MVYSAGFFSQYDGCADAVEAPPERRVVGWVAGSVAGSVAASVVGSVADSVLACVARVIFVAVAAVVVVVVVVVAAGDGASIAGKALGASLAHPPDITAVAAAADIDMSK